jgi:hypothetical protein
LPADVRTHFKSGWLSENRKQKSKKGKKGKSRQKKAFCPFCFFCFQPFSPTQASLNKSFLASDLPGYFRGEERRRGRIDYETINDNHFLRAVRDCAAGMGAKRSGPSGGATQAATRGFAQARRPEVIGQPARAF